MPILGHKLEVVLVSPGLGVEHDNRAGIKIASLARAGREVWRRIAAGDVQFPSDRV